MVTAIFTTIALSINNRKNESPELISNSMAHIKAKTLSNEALNYSIKQVLDGHIPATQSEYLQVFSNFDVIDGTIDSIKYVMNASLDTLTIISYVSAQIAGKTSRYASTAKLLFQPGSSVEAFNCSKEVDMKGNAEIVGGLRENVSLNFNQTFGYTMAEMKARADNYLKNPKTQAGFSSLSGITYVELTGNKSLHLSGNWGGSGILIIDGNFKDTGRANFQGVIWASGGSFMMTGNSSVAGAVFVDTNDTVKLSGNTYVEYDETIVSPLINTGGGGGATTVQILSWDN